MATVGGDDPICKGPFCVNNYIPEKLVQISAGVMEKKLWQDEVFRWNV